MDIQLPGKNGLEVTADIRALSNPFKSSIPIVAMTGHTQDDDIKACLTAGMNDFLGKPISPELLYSITIKTIAGQYESMAHTLNDIEPMDPESHDDEFDRIVREMEERENLNPIPNFDFKSNGLNKDIIVSLQKSLGKEQTKELLVSFYETTDTILEQLKTLKNTDNFEDIYARAHELKGMAANFGFEQLSHIASDIETASQQKNPSAIETGTDQLLYAYDTGRNAMDTFLS
jgi:CheY-like chemotaxis protein